MQLTYKRHPVIVAYASGFSLIAHGLRVGRMKIGRFRAPRDPMVAYGTLAKASRSKAKLGAALIRDIGKRVAVLQRQLKALRKSAERSTDANAQSGSSSKMTGLRLSH
jgi:hypothetical protein